MAWSTNKPTKSEWHDDQRWVRKTGKRIGKLQPCERCRAIAGALRRDARPCIEISEIAYQK